MYYLHSSPVERSNPIGSKIIIKLLSVYYLKFIAAPIKLIVCVVI